MTGTMSSVSDDDEDENAALPVPVPVQPSRSGVLEQKMYFEYPAVANGADHDGFAVMVHLKAPALVTAAALDLVAVLDVGASMAAGGNKLAQVKRAMAFVVDRLGPRDRLGVVSFSGADTAAARQVVPLTRMTDDGKAAAKLAVAALEAAAASSSTPAAPTTKTNVRAGLDEAEKVLDRGRPWSIVSTVILISDDGHGSSSSSCCDDDDGAVPEYFRPSSGYGGTPVHTFGLASDRLDAAAMHGVSAATGGTFSFVEDHAVIQDAVARCLAGLASVTARGAWLEISIAPSCPITDDHFNVTAGKSGRYRARIARACDEAEVDVGDLYADEERRVLLFMDIPRLDDAAADGITRLVNVHCYYTDAATGQNVELPDGDGYYEIERPVETTPDMAARCVEVERELLRVAAAEDMAAARDAAERGDYAEAARILDARRESLLGRSSAAPAMSGDAVCAAVADELRELSRRVADEREYGRTGRACILASMTSHGLQRGSPSVRLGCGGAGSSSVFATPAMRKMEKLSERLRKQQEAPPRPPLPKNGSNTGVTLGSRRRRLEASRLASAVPSLSMLSRYRRLLLKR